MEAVDGEAGRAGPTMPRWVRERPYLTGRFHQEIKQPSSRVPFSRRSEIIIGSYPVSIQELLIIDDLLSALVGIEGRYISIKRIRGNEGHMFFQIDPSTDLALQELAERLFPLCENFIMINEFVESRSYFKNGLVNHAFAAALRTLLLDYQAMVAQLEHQFRLGRLSIQGLWFFCQQMIGPMNALSTVTEKVSAENLSGSATLNLLQSQAKAMAGDSTVRALLEKMAHCASSAYLCMLERWIYEGIIDDPYGEFFIAENKSLQKESLMQDFDSKYWEQRYSLKENIPSFLANAAGTILTTGKYLNVMRECGHHVQVPASDALKITSSGSSYQYLECIKASHAFASTELLNLIKEKYDLVGKLRSLKHYFLLDQGDFLVHFMDIARNEISKRSEEISVEKLQSLLELALRSTAAVSDPCNEDLMCCMEKVPLLRKLALVKSKDASSLPDSSKPISDSYNHESVNITGLETFCLNYKVQWPLSLVISRKALTKYQLIFRFVFHCKHVNRQLCMAWQVHQGFRAINMLGTVVMRSSILCRSMLRFINSLLHYLTFEVLEPNWHLMHGRLQNAKSIDEAAQCHYFFLEKCLKECLLLLPHLFKKIENLKFICLQYAASIQLLMPSICVSERQRQSSKASSEYASLKSEVRAEDPPLLLESIRKFEKEFNYELQSLRPLLSSSSQAEPYLTHLAQCVLGVGSDK